MFAKILVPTDGSEYSRRALLAALEMGKKFNGEIILLNVLMTPEALGYLLSEDATVVQQQFNPNGEATLAATTKNVDLGGVRLTCRVKPGYPALVILEEIVSEDIDLVVMGYRGYTSLAGTFMGSVSQKVLAKTSRPVLLIK
ncbi:nucleotide-binding universal stress UspA family protein [Desulfitobacterium sp. LBE]|uniref:UspA domain-containing protein n=4 Tax=root TaxID=1 RepID=Q24MQ6_DESHY|nr:MULTISPECIES: universal stress protein [Desulfitobacterium]ACL22770.1 UspA domain protein [Desulfitobacterium hafniense DCB-2]KTE93573.1 universal stress protein UspA [Desulfitobacterium hafniense]MEA5021995.1 universal stress protein [Desulfitobacterium hafniense]TWH59205.1 nucleotide-binding universal stress UspA family protein [Desulfitobacterium sp. LBE]CDX05038.1 Universal stress protein [Desulfitobacterium hafniense]